MISPALVRSLGRLLAFVLFLIEGSGCATLEASNPPRPAMAAIQVNNRSWFDVVVYLADGNVPFRLGRVGALDRTRLAIPNQAAALGVRVLVRSIETDQVFAGDPLLPGAGGVLELTVEPLLDQSTLSVLSYGPLESRER